jgi:hypothetical protein
LAIPPKQNRPTTLKRETIPFFIKSHVSQTLSYPLGKPRELKLLFGCD